MPSPTPTPAGLYLWRGFHHLEAGENPTLLLAARDYTRARRYCLRRLDLCGCEEFTDLRVRRCTIDDGTPAAIAAREGEVWDPAIMRAIGMHEMNGTCGDCGLGVFEALPESHLESTDEADAICASCREA